MLYNVVLVYAVQQSASVLCIRVPLLPGPSSHPPIPPSRSPESPRLSPLYYAVAPTSYQFCTWCVYVSLLLSRLSHCPLPPHVHMSFLYVCISIPALQIGSSVLYHFSRLHTYTLIYICFSLSDFTLLFMTDSIHLHILQISSTYEVPPMIVVIY